MVKVELKVSLLAFTWIKVQYSFVHFGTVYLQDVTDLCTDCDQAADHSAQSTQSAQSTTPTASEGCVFAANVKRLVFV